MGLISSTIFGARRLAWVKGTRRDLIRSHSTAINKTIVRLLATFDRHKTSFHNASGRGTRRADAEQGRLWLERIAQDGAGRRARADPPHAARRHGVVPGF